MNIRINGDDARIELEEETNAGEVVAALVAWGAERGFHFFEAEYEGLLCHRPDDPRLSAISVDAPGTLNVILAPAVEFALRALQEVHDHLGKMKDALAAPGPLTDLHRSHLLDGQRTLLEAVEACDRALRLGRESEEVAARLRDLEIRLHRLSDEGDAGRAACARLIEETEPGLLRILQRTHFAHFRNLLPELKAADASAFALGDGLRMLVRTAALLPATAAAMQTGKDAEAMRNLADMTQAFELAALLFDRLILLLRIEDPAAGSLTDDVEPVFRAVHDVLERTEKALQARDISTFGDLVEYELGDLMPRLEGLLRDLAARFPAPDGTLRL